MSASATTHKKVLLCLSGPAPLASVKLDALKEQLVDMLGLDGTDDILVLPAGVTFHVFDAIPKKADHSHKGAEKKEK